MSISGFEYDFNQLLLISLVLLTGSYLLERWFPSTSGPAMPFLLVISFATGIVKVMLRMFVSFFRRTGLLRRASSDRTPRKGATTGSRHHHYHFHGNHHGVRRTLSSSGEQRDWLAKDGLQRSGGEKLGFWDWMIFFYRGIPLNTTSRLWGKLHRIELPHWFRPHAFRLYIWLYGCQLEEALVENLYHYKNLSEFFRRSLKPEVRPIHPFSSLTSPCDGQVLYCGRVVAGHMEQVKGVRYTLQNFLGPATWKQASSSSGTGMPRCSSSHTFQDTGSEDHAFQESIKQQMNTDLYHCVIYLAPGDYHRFHSPSEWTVKCRRHFPGKLLSVNPRVAKWVQGLFSINERAIYYGDWRHGFFSYTAVGATNVGSIRVFCDPKLQTNTRQKHRRHHFSFSSSLSPLKSFPKSRLFYDSVLATSTTTHTEGPDPQVVTTTTSTMPGSASNLEFKRGDLFGEFNFGSTVVLIFEAPKNFRFSVTPHQKIRVGQALGSLITDFRPSNQPKLCTLAPEPCADLLLV